MNARVLAVAGVAALLGSCTLLVPVSGLTGGAASQDADPSDASTGDAVSSDDADSDGADVTSGDASTQACVAATASARFGDSMEQVGRSVTIDAQGNVLVAGQFAGTLDLGSPSLV